MSFSKTLLSWYYENKRDLPWRNTKDPYRIWLSEIILQQTRIDQGLPYYNRFVETFPDIFSLANAGESIVLKTWQGLGYYSRARYLHETAREISIKHDGNFPEDYSSIRNLKGIGDYTAAAIASISFNLPYPVVDGNVLRFLSRFFGVLQSIDKQKTRNDIRNLASAHITHESPGDFNQAMMEFGATVCKPSNPQCPNCLFKSHCIAFQLNMVSVVPARTPKTAQKNRYLNYFVITFIQDGQEWIILNKRVEKGIWRNLYDFPCIETNQNEIPQRFIESQNFPVLLSKGDPQYHGASEIYSHVLTHQRLTVRFYRFMVSNYEEGPYRAVPVQSINEFPFPRVIASYLVNARFI